MSNQFARWLPAFGISLSVFYCFSIISDTVNNGHSCNVSKRTHHHYNEFDPSSLY